MDFNDVGGFSTSSRSMTWSRRTGLEAHSKESPYSNFGKQFALRKSSSLPRGGFSVDPVVDATEEIEDATLYCIQAPSNADLTACASGMLNNLALSSRCFKTTLPSAVSIVRLAPTQRPHLDIVRISKSDDVLDQVSPALWPTDTHQIREDLIPSIPSFLSSSSAQHIKAHDMIRASSQPQAQPLLSYGIIGTLGRGTYGKVVLACMKDDLDGELYAMKIVRMQGKHEIGPELATLQLLLASSRTSNDDGFFFLQRLREAFRVEDSLFIVMEYHPTTLSDPELASRFRIRELSQPGLSPSISLPLTFSGHVSLLSNSGEEAIVCLRFLIAEISLGLEFLHHRGIVHQDIKPANIMVSFAGHAVIGDFGATTNMPLIDRKAAAPSFLFDNYTAGTQNRRYGSIVLQAEDFITFTPLYAAPELRERNSAGLVVYDERSDWWSLGVLLYELVIGIVPFQVHPSSGADVRGRRSDGDHSLAFGSLEVLSGPFKAAKCGWYPCLEDFLRSLLSHDLNDRLSWPDIKDHAFLEPLRGLWTDVANLKYPPCPDPPTSYVNDDASLTVEEGDDAELGDVRPNATCSAQGSHFFPDDATGSVLQGDISVDDVFDSSPHISLLQSWHPTAQNLDDDGLDDASILQAMPSSASLFWAAERSPEFHGKILDVPFFMSGSLRSDDGNLADTQLLQSPFCSTPILSPLPHPSSVLSCDMSGSLKAAHYLLALPDSVVPEEITISLLEAMDNRDRTAGRDRGKRCEAKKGPIQRLGLTALGRVWRKLFVW